MSFMSRWQSALLAVLGREDEETTDLASEHPVMVASCDACGVLERAMEAGVDPPELAEEIKKTDLVSACAQMYVSLAAAKVTGNTERVHELEAELQYSVCDPLWAKVLFEFDSNHAETNYRHFEELDDFVLPLEASDPPSGSDGRVKVAFVSDWGTGTRLAKNVMRCIGDQQPDIVIHLGDVYYSGTKDEMQDHFLSIVREHLPPTTRVFNLAGNHDLYAGGEGYYWLIDELGQPASYFCLRNEEWQIMAIGAPPEIGAPMSALSVVPDIDPKELAWHQHKIETSEGRKTVMLSHYQLFTASGNIGRTADNRPLALNPVFYEAFGPQLPSIDVWLWGHEHNLAAFEPYAGLRKGRCIGSGAIPVDLLWQPYKQLPNLALHEGFDAAPVMRPDCQLGDDGDHYHHAFCVLSIDGSDGEMNYFEVPGVDGDARIVYTESI